MRLFPPPLAVLPSFHWDSAGKLPLYRGRSTDTRRRLTLDGCGRRCPHRVVSFKSNALTNPFTADGRRRRLLWLGIVVPLGSSHRRRSPIFFSWLSIVACSLDPAFGWMRIVFLRSGAAADEVESTRYGTPWYGQQHPGRASDRFRATPELFSSRPRQASFTALFSRIMSMTREPDPSPYRCCRGQAFGGPHLYKVRQEVEVLPAWLTEIPRRIRLEFTSGGPKQGKLLDEESLVDIQRRTRSAVCALKS